MKTVCLLTFLISTSLYAGRYELHQNQQYPNRSILLDSQSGKMWTPACYTEQKDGECAVKAWAPLDIIGVNVTEADVWKAVENLQKSNQTKK